jgi:hypothetical protein
MQYSNSRSQETIALCPHPASKQQKQQPRAMTVLTPRPNAPHVPHPYPAGIQPVPSRLKAPDERRVWGCLRCENVRIGFTGYRLRQCGQHHGSGGAPSALGRRSERPRAHSKGRNPCVPSRNLRSRTSGGSGAAQDVRVGVSGCRLRLCAQHPRQRRRTECSGSGRAQWGSQDAHLRHVSSRCSASSLSSGVLGLVGRRGTPTDRPVSA